MNEIGIANWLQKTMNDEFIVMHICMSVSGLLISSSGFVLLSL
jgi:hypothetical protein